MTAHPIDRARARFEDYIEEGMGYEPSRGEAMAVLDALAAAEYRATRAEAQSEARRINAAYWKERAESWRSMWRQRGVKHLRAEARIKAVRELHAPFEWSFGYGPVKSCRECARRSPQEDAEYPCPTIRALDGDA